MNNLVVFGGTGFLGRRICQLGLENGFQVTSLSRSGKPPLNTSTNDKYWIKEVSWEKCDIFNPETYEKHLVDANNVVHTIGILLEDENYKSKVRGTGGIFGGIFNPRKLIGSGSNPLKPKNNPYFSYEMMNKQSSLLLAQTFANVLKKQGIDDPLARTMTYVSADKGFPLIPKGYIESKRAAEVGIMKHEDTFRPIIMRPGFMFDEYNESRHSDQQKDMRSRLKDVLEVLNYGNRLVLGNKLSCVNDLIRPTVSTQQVSRAIVSKIEDSTFRGVVSLEEILNI